MPEAANDEFKYEVAFSFLAIDEPLARRMNDGLADRMTTFLYSERQKELAGKDGEEAFKSVFRSESRTVVVLFREGWGETPWTRMEQEAIRERAYYHGYDFVLFIKLEADSALPSWMPKTRLYLGLRAYGEKAALAVIEQRVTEAGGQVEPDTATLCSIT